MLFPQYSVSTIRQNRAEDNDRVKTTGVSLAVRGVVASTNKGMTFSGTVTGGTGAFKGATGTITGKVISSNKASVTIVYS